MTTFGSPTDPEVEAALRRYASGPAWGEWRSSGEIAAAVEALLDYAVERFEVGRVLRMMRDGERAMEFQERHLAPEIIRYEWRYIGDRRTA